MMEVDAAGLGSSNAGFENMPVPFLKVAPSGDILSLNKMAVRLLGVEPRDDLKIGQLMEGLGRPMSDWLRDTAADSQHIFYRRPHLAAGCKIKAD